MADYAVLTAHEILDVPNGGSRDLFFGPGHAGPIDIYSGPDLLKPPGCRRRRHDDP